MIDRLVGEWTPGGGFLAFLAVFGLVWLLSAWRADDAPGAWGADQLEDEGEPDRV